MQRVVPAFVKEIAFRRCSVRVRYYVLLLIIDIQCSTGIVMVYVGVNEDVAIE